MLRNTRRTVARVLGTMCAVCMLAVGGLPTSAAAVSDSQVHIYPNRIIDMQGAKYMQSGHFTTDLSGGLTIWRPKAVESYAALGDGSTHLRFPVKVNLAQMSKVYVTAAETTPVPVNMSITIKGVQVTICSGQILEAGKEYSFDLLKTYREMFEDNTKTFPDVEKEYDMYVSALFEGAFSDTTKVRLQSLYFAKDSVAKATEAGANEAIKLDFNTAVVPELMDVNVKKDGSFTVHNNHSDILFAAVTAEIDLNKTPYIYLDIEGCSPEDIFFMDVFKADAAEGEVRLLGFAELDSSRLAFRYDLRKYAAKLGLDSGSGKIRVQVGNYDNEDPTTYTIHGVYFGDEYFVFKGAMSSGNVNSNATTNVSTNSTNLPDNSTTSNVEPSTNSTTSDESHGGSNVESNASGNENTTATKGTKPVDSNEQAGNQFPWLVLVLVVVAVAAVSAGAYYLLLVHPYRKNK